MYPILFEWNGEPVPAWHVFFILGAMASFYFLFFFRRIYYPELGQPHLRNIFAVAYVSGYFGARLLSIFIDEGPLLGIGDLFQRLFVLGAMTFYGGFILVCLVLYVYVKVQDLSLWQFIDVVVPCGLIGLAIGRIGCFLNGDDYGISVLVPKGQTIPWWAVVFPYHMERVPRVPVQLIESIGVIILIILTYFLTAKKSRQGAFGLNLVLGLAILRFFDEYLRGDERGWFVRDILSPAQGISIFLAVVVGSAWLRLRQTAN